MHVKISQKKEEERMDLKMLEDPFFKKKKKG